MNPRLIALVILGVALIGLSQVTHPPSISQEVPLAASQAESTRTRTVSAVFSSKNSGGMVTDVYVTASEGPDGTEAVLEVSRYRPMCEEKGCPDVRLHAFNQIPLVASDLQFGPGLSSATLRATVPVSERLTQDADTVTIDLTWTATGRMARDEHEVGERFQRARASGSIRSGATNFTPKQSNDAQIEERA
jgi:hypothetical protein